MQQKVSTIWQSEVTIAFLAAAFLTLNMLDAALTNWLIANPMFSEANPVMSAIAGTPLLHLKGPLGLVLAVLLCRVFKTPCRRVLLLLTIGTLGFCAWNISLLGTI